jgi:hypothetical protein
MKHLVIFLTCLLGAALAGRAQQTTDRYAHPKYEAQMEIGGIIGSSSQALSIQAINGIRYRSLFMGAGADIDWYYLRSIPVFAHLQKFFFKRRSAPLIYAQLGGNFPWMPKTLEYNSKRPNTYQGGVFYEAGLGYLLKIDKRFYLLFNAGYSVKKIGETRYPLTGYLQSSDEYYYTLRRLTLKLGFGF